jgi:hypothetical protein
MDTMNGGLKKNRVIDDQSSSAFNTHYGSPNKTTQGKNFGAENKNSPSKISPNKPGQGTAKYNDNSNGQVMTQISAIYAKRSRSILN